MTNRKSAAREAYDAARRDGRPVSRATNITRDLIQSGGLSVHKACGITGLAPSTIYRSKWWADFKRSTQF